MEVFVNGKFLPASQATVSVQDRGLLYGDGLFETIRAEAGRPLWLRQHLTRLAAIGGGAKSGLTAGFSVGKSDSGITAAKWFRTRFGRGEDSHHQGRDCRPGVAGDRPADHHYLCPAV